MESNEQNQRELHTLWEKYHLTHSTKPTELERIVADTLGILGYDFRYKKGFLRGAERFCMVDFYTSKPYKVAIQVLEEKPLYVEEECLKLRRIHLLYLTSETIQDEQKLKDKITLFMNKAQKENYNKKKLRADRDIYIGN